MEHLHCELGQAPSAQRCINPSKQRTWLDPDYRDMKVQIHYSNREYRKTDSVQDWHKYLSLKTLLRNCIKEKKTEIYSGAMEQAPIDREK